MDLRTVLLGKVQVRQNVDLAIIDEGGELWPLLSKLISHVT
jgi:hypothetical protein